MMTKDEIEAARAYFRQWPYIGCMHCTLILPALDALEGVERTRALLDRYEVMAEQQGWPQGGALSWMVREARAALGGTNATVSNMQRKGEP